jgi:hypothetical protein
MPEAEFESRRNSNPRSGLLFLRAARNAHTRDTTVVELLKMLKLATLDNAAPVPARGTTQLSPARSAG